MRWRSPSGFQISLRRLERVERFAVRAVADRVHADREAGGCAAAHDLRELGAARDLHAAAVEHPRGLRAERAVHEHLQVADAQHRAAEPRPQADRRGRVDEVCGDRLPHAKRELPALLELPPEPQRAEPAVLVVHRRHAARVGKAHTGAHRVEVRVVGDEHVLLLEPPRRLLAEHAGRLAVLVAFDDAARHVEVAVRERERGRVEPERVVVLRDQPGRHVAGDRIEVVARRLACRLPVAATPAVAAQPAARPRRDALQSAERFLERRAAVEVDLVLRERPRREVDVRVGEAGDDDATAEVEHLRRGKCRLVDADPTGDAVAGDRERSLGRNLRVERPDQAVLEDHGAQSSTLAGLEVRSCGSALGRVDESEKGEAR